VTLDEMWLENGRENARLKAAVRGACFDCQQMRLRSCDRCWLWSIEQKKPYGEAATERPSEF
jgi:hypothetical protein